MTTHEHEDAAPLTETTRRLQDALSLERWAVVEAHARRCVQILEDTERAYGELGSWRRALAAVAPEVPWPTFLNWRRRAAERAGAPWERQLDLRVPPEPKRHSDRVVAAVCALRQVAPRMTCQEARPHLIRQFGAEEGNVSDACLKRIWKEAGLAQPRGGARTEKVTQLNGGAGLAFLAAAVAETGIVEALAASVLERAAEAAAAQGIDPAAEVAAGAEERDDRGRFTAEYNRAVRGAGPRDPRRDSDARKRERRRLSKLALVSSSEATVAHKLLALGVTPLLTERRGFDGLEDPSGAWLSALGGTAYQPSTLDKFLTEVALVDAGEALWARHAEQWVDVTRAWTSEPDEPRWLRWAVYIDATQDPYWTRSFAVSGKVSRVNRVMPCITRVAMMGGPGVPLVVETSAGTVSLKKELLPFLQRVETSVGLGELGRLTIMDAEMATVSVMADLQTREDAWFVTVAKGPLARSGVRGEPGEWQRYREHDLIREVPLRLQGAGAPEGGLELRGIEMVREGSRNPTTTLFVTDATAEELTTEEVPSSYLSRWPHQEQRFRDGRNGLGLDRSHGYGGELVTHVALSTALEKAEKSVARAQTRLTRAQDAEKAARGLLDATATGQRKAARAALQAAERATRQAERALTDAEAKQRKLQTTPREIYVRDTTRDSIVTCMKLTVLMLIEFVLKEYFGGARMEVRTFIGAFMHLPVTIRERSHEVVYELHENPRSPSQSALLREACAEITRRGLQVRGKRLRFTTGQGA